MLKSLILTIFIGFFFLLGILIPKFFKNKNQLTLIATGLTFIIMIFLMLFDLIPEIIEILEPIQNPKYLLLILIFVLLGIIILKLLDCFVPDHTHHHKEDEENINEHNGHLFHIGLITAISLTIHNILEGISVYVTGLSSLESGLLMAVTVGLHNLPLGIDISVNMDASKNRKITKMMIYLLLILSSSFGAFILFLLKMDLNFLLEGILLSLTLGMIIYISIFELFHEVKENKDKREMKIGIFIGIIIAILMKLL